MNNWSRGHIISMGRKAVNAMKRPVPRSISRVNSPVPRKAVEPAPLPIREPTPREQYNFDLDKMEPVIEEIIPAIDDPMTVDPFTIEWEDWTPTDFTTDLIWRTSAVYGDMLNDELNCM